MMLLLMLLSVDPGTTAPVIDGRIDAAEWAGASRQATTNGGELYVLPHGDFLYVGIRGPNAGLASLCIVKDGRVARILRASAPVGGAARVAFLGQSGWLANASGAGSPEREFQIRLADVDAVAVTYLPMAEPLRMSYWPGVLDDDCREVKVPKGFLPATATFRPGRWRAVDKE